DQKTADCVHQPVDGLVANRGFSNQGACLGLTAAAARGTIRYDHRQLEICLADMKTQGCDQFLDFGTSSCESLFVGTVPVGGSCQSGWDCASSLCSPLCSGTCVGMPIAQLGEDCETRSCAQGLICFLNQPRTCKVPVADGER